MRSDSASGPAPDRLLVVLSLAAVYVVWGSTYLGIRFALEGFPPLLMSSIRFAVAGGLMYGWLRLRGAPNPTPRQWWNATQLGGFLLVGGTGLVSIAEDLGVGSGIAAVAIAAVPLWAALLGGLFGQRSIRLEWVGLIVGFAGVALLAGEGDFQASVAGAILIIVAPISWAFGSVRSPALDLPSNGMATASQMLAGSVLLGVAGLIAGESIAAPPSAKAWWALVYLIVMGSLVAYSAYVFLLHRVRPALATSYAYANPMVAVMLGITLGGETITGFAYAALPIILSGVALVVVAQRGTQGPARPRDAGIAPSRD
jgi:drug/metabolite transporter (DMT)-like permease